MDQQEAKPKDKNECTNNASESKETEIHATLRTELEVDKESSGILKKTSDDSKREKDVEPPKRNITAQRIINTKTSLGKTASGFKTTSSSMSRDTGHSKPPMKSSSVSAARKSTGFPIASSSRPIKSVNSSGGSSNEKRKSLVSVTRRTSLTSLSQNQPAKIESLPEKRGISTVNARKPTTSSISSNLKPVRSNSTVSKFSGITKNASTVTAKSSISGTLPDSKRRLSNASGSIIITKPSNRNSSIASKDVDEFRVKLEISTAKIEEQENQIKTAQERINELCKQLEDETKKFVLTEKNLKQEHSEQVEKLDTKYEAEVQKMQTDLERARSDLVIVQESLPKSVEEARQNEATKNDTTIKKLKEEFELSISSLNAELADAKAACASATSKLSERDTEITSLKSQITRADEHKKTLEQESQSSIFALKQSLKLENETALSALRAEYDQMKAKHDDEIKSIHDQEIATLTQQSETKISELKASLEKAEASLAEAENNHKQILESQISESNKLIKLKSDEIVALKCNLEEKSTLLVKSSQTMKELNEKYESLDKQYQDALIDLDNVSGRPKGLHPTDLQEINSAQDELAQVKAQLTAQREMMATFNADGKSKDELYNKIKMELDTAINKLKDKDNEIAQLLKDHDEKLHKIFSAHDKEISAIRGDSAKLKERIKQYENSLAHRDKELSDTEQNHIKEVRSLQSKILSLERELRTLKTTYEKNVEETKEKTNDEARQDLNKADFTELQNLEASHKEFCSSLQNDQLKSQPDALSTIEKLRKAETFLKGELEGLKNDLLKTQNELSINKQNLARENMEKAQALAELDAVQNRKIETENSKYEDNLNIKTALEQLKGESVVKEAEAKKKYTDLKELMTRLIGEANEKAMIVESRLKEAEAQLKLKEAEISEVKS